jgi:hypothetical protein
MPVATRLYPLSVAAVLFSFLAFSACSPGEDDSDDSNADSDADADTDTDSDSDADADTDTGEMPMGSLAGVVEHENGSPWPDLQVNLCLTGCRTTTTGSDGSFLLQYLDPGRYSLDVVAGDDLPTVLIPADVQADVANTLSAPIVPLAFETLSAVGSGVADMPAGTGLVLEVDPDALTLPFGTDEAKVGGVAVPGEQFPPLESLPGTAVAVWYLGLYDIISDPPMPFEIENVYKLGAGDPVEVYDASYDDHDWLLATATVSEDGLVIRSDEGQGVTSLATLVLASGL